MRRRQGEDGLRLWRSDQVYISNIIMKNVMNCIDIIECICARSVISRYYLKNIMLHVEF